MMQFSYWHIKYDFYPSPSRNTNPLLIPQHHRRTTDLIGEALSSHTAPLHGTGASSQIHSPIERKPVSPMPFDPAFI